MDSRLFTALPEDLASLSTEDLQAAIDDRRAIVLRVKANDPELLPASEWTAEQILDELTFCVEQIKALSSEQELRAEATAEFERRVELAASEAGVVALSAEQEDPTGDDDEGDAGDGDEDAEGTVELAADADPDPVPLRRPLPAPAADREPVVVEQDAVPHAAGFMVKDREIDRMEFANLALATARRIDPSPSAPRVQQVIAAATWNAPESRKLHHNDPEGNADKIRAVMPESLPQDALVASGGLCAPLTPIYDLPQISSEVRPLRDGLPAFQAARGGITWAVPPSIADVTDSVGIVTAANDAQGGTFATKTCQFLDCQDFLSAEIAAIYHCLEWGNIGSRAWPERVAQFTDVVMAAWSRLAETNILNLMKAGSDQVTAAAATYGYGARSSLISEMLTAAAGYRSRFRMAPDSRFRVVAPQWVRDLILSDLANSQFYAFELNYAGIDAYFRSHGIDPIWTLDGETGGGQVYGAQSAGALLSFPTSVKWFLFPEGTWIWVSMGVLELGIVRDSTLNAVNDFQVFGEGFETVAQVGYQSLEVTSTLCPSGTTGGTATAITCS